MSTDLRHHAIRAGILALLCALLLSGAAASSQGRPHGRRNVDLAASAFPTGARPHVFDATSVTTPHVYRTVKADTTATASASCNNCHGDAVALQVLYVHGPHDSEFDNSAVAWAACTACRATALSVQLVVVHGGRAVTVNNRALALNASCTRCLTAALAVQLVVHEPSGRRLSHKAVRRLRTWVDRQALKLRSQPVPTAREAQALLPPLEDLVNGDLGGTTLQAQVNR